MRQSRPLIALVALTSLLLMGCPGGGSGGGGESSTDLRLRWKVENTNQPTGVAVHPTTGEVYLGVSFGQAPFGDGGGAMIVTPQGAVAAQVPMVFERECDTCVRYLFSPNAPVVAESGAAVYFGDYYCQLFRLDTASRTARLQPFSNPNDISLGIAGLTSTSALSPDGTRAFVPASQVYVLGLDGTVEKALDFGASVYEVDAVSSDTYVLNLTGGFDEDGAVAVWTPATGEARAFKLPHRVAAVASRDGWTVAVLETGLGQYQLAELDWRANPMAVQLLAKFEVPSGAIHVALRPDKRQAVIGSGGLSSVDGSGNVSILVGSTLLVDAAKGAIAVAGTSSVRGVELSPDGATLYVADTGGLKAFALP